MCEDIQSRNPINTAKSSRWLSEFAKNITSQFGEDGIIEKILEVIADNDKWCVEVGSWDGKYCSNTFNLIKHKGYFAVLIEANKSRFKDLLRTHQNNEKIIPINAFVGFDEDNRLDTLLKTTKIPVNFDLLSIDIDGNDYHVWEAVKQYKPKVVVIEYNPTAANSVEFVQLRDMRTNQGSSLLSTKKLAESKGYELIAVTHTNAIFVDSKYYGLFGIKDNSLQVMRKDESAVTHILSGYDGTIFIKGCGQLCWHGIAYNESKVQQLPKWLRQYPGQYSTVKRIFVKIYKRIRAKKAKQ